MQPQSPSPSEILFENPSEPSPATNEVLPFLNLEEGWAVLPEAPAGLTDVFPFDGQPVDLSDGALSVTGVWRQSRKFIAGKFEPTSFWAIHNGGGQRIAFEPVGYREHQDAPFYQKPHKPE